MWIFFPGVYQNFREAVCLSGQLPCMPSSCGVFRGTEKLANSCSVALCAVDLKGCLRLLCQWADCSECRGSLGMAQDLVSTALSTADPMGFLRICSLHRSRAASSLPQHKLQGGRGRSGRMGVVFEGRAFGRSWVLSLLCSQQAALGLGTWGRGCLTNCSECSGYSRMGHNMVSS